MQDLMCSVCGGDEFRQQRVLWSDLVSEWQLSEQERDYVDRQQGCSCIRCGSSLRIVALGNAIRAVVGTANTLQDAIGTGQLSHLRILDCNGANGISSELSVLPFYKRADFPEYDMMQLPFDDGSFDLVLHSDTLEHIPHPIVALQECRRVLNSQGSLCFTVPIIHGRLSRNRAGLAPSYHGDPSDARDDHLVHTEFGADVWTFVHQAGFTNLTLNHVDFPSAVAITAWTEATPARPSADSSEADDTITSSSQVSEDGPGSEESPSALDGIYDQDGLRSGHNHEFMSDPVFQAAYARGIKAAGTDYQWHWRVHTGLWAASMAAKLTGDFIEFGVNRGFLSSAIMQLLDWNRTGRRFYLLDTFSGIDERFINDDDRLVGVLERNRREIESGFYTFDLDEVRANFAEWPTAILIPGAVPDTLAQIDADSFAFAHIDMNCAPPEVAAAEFLWPRLVPGAIVLLDDYAYSGYRSQKLAMDKFALSKNVPILSLPTGQGLIIKPPV